MSIGKNIKKIRKERGLTQVELGKKLNVTQQMIGQYENDKNSPQMDTIKKIANALEVKVADLMGISDYLDEVESSLQKTTSFWDYLGVLGYEIGQSEHEDYQMHIKENDTYIELSSEDVQLLKELEDSTSKDIKRTIELLIATKIRP